MKSNQIFMIVGLIAALFVCTVIGGGGAYLWYTQQQETGDSAPAEAVEAPLPTEPAAAEVAAEPTTSEPSDGPNEAATPADQTASEPTATPTAAPPPTEAPVVEQASAGNVITWSGQDQPIAYGDTAQGTIAQIGDRHTYVFEGEEGERVTALLEGKNFNFYLIAPDDKGWDCQTYSTDCQLDRVELPMAGEYRLIVDGREDHTGDYSLTLVKQDETIQPIAYSQSVNGAIAQIGDRHTYVFEGEEGERVTALLEGKNFNFYLIAPDDKGWDCQTYSTDCQLDRVELPMAGEYRLIVDGREDHTGDYSLTLVKQDETIEPIAYSQSVDGAIAQIGDRHTYVFEGEEGERVTALLEGKNFNFYLIAPDDKGWDCQTYSTDCQLDRVELPMAGEYRLIVDGREDHTGDYSLTLVKQDETIEPIAYSQSVDGAIAQIGDRHTYVFEGEEGERVTALLEGKNFNFYLIAPDDKGWDCQTYSTDCQLDRVELPMAGEYRLIVDGREDHTGDYSLTLVKQDETIQPIAYGQTVEGTIAQIGDQHTYVFEGQAGERITALLDGAGDFNFYIIAPDDRGWDCRTYSGECQFDTGELPVSGGYRVIVDGYEEDTGDYSLTLVKNSG